MPAERLNLKGDYRIEMGADYEIQITCTDANGDVYDLTGATCTAEVRETPTGTATAFTSSIDTDTGIITLSLTAVQTAAFTYFSGEWDAFLTESDGTDSKLFKGSVQIEHGGGV